MAYEGSITIADLMDGAPGADGSSVSKATILYYLDTKAVVPVSPQSQSSPWSEDRDVQNQWTKKIPTYVSGATYYVCLESEITNDVGVRTYVYGDAVEDNGLTDAASNSSEAVAISRATRQHFWFVSEKTGTIDAGAYITDTPIDTFKQGKSGGYLYASSTGLTLGKDNNTLMALSGSELDFYRPGTSTIDATLTSKGLVLSKGGIEAGAKNTTNYIYIYSDDDATNHKLTINSHKASDWRIVAGKNFGVDKAGNLYASGANIQGKITITSGSNVYTKTEADAAYDKKGAASAVQTNLDNLEIGGRNLARGTAEMIKGGGAWSTGTWRDSGASSTYNYTVSDSPVPSVNKGVLVTTKNTKNQYGVAQDHCPMLSKQITFSVWAKGTEGGKIKLQSAWWNGISGSTGNTKIILATGEWQFVSVTTDLTSQTVPNGSCSICYLYWIGTNVNDTCVFVAPKLEYGNKATAWSPAPEDVQAEIDAKKSVHTLNTNYSYSYADILTYSAEGYGGTAGASWSVSSTEGVKQGDTVRIKVTVSDMSNTPVYIIGTVVSVTSATVLKAISHGLDTTVIDGGNILTNSIGANQIKANSLTIGKIATAEQEKILNSKIEIGGRNLVWDTEWKNISTRWSNWGSPTTREIVTANGKRWLHLVTTASAHQGYSQAQDKRNGYGEIKAGDKVVISYSAYAKTAGQICTVGCHWRNSSGTNVAQNWFSSTLTTTEKRYTSPVFTIPNNAVGFNVMIGDGTANAQELWISQVKIEFGTKATDWTPAPEDLAATATSYITDIGNDGIRVHPASTENNSVLINSDGMTVYKGGTADKDSVAFYGDTARIGEKASRHIEVKSGGMQVYNGEGDSNMVTHIGYESVQGETGATMGAFFTFGKRKSNQTKGEYSVAEGYGTTASGYSSHAEGYETTASYWSSHAEGRKTTASGIHSHAEGFGTTASNWASHAEGYYATASGSSSHAEGFGTTASGGSSHAEGYETTASGDYSHAGGFRTTAERRAQTAIGEYNVTDASGEANKRGKYVLIVGNGTSDARSNALTVSWDGNVELAIDSSATGSSTVDGKIMDSLRSLGWDASTEGVLVYD